MTTKLAKVCQKFLTRARRKHIDETFSMSWSPLGISARMVVDLQDNLLAAKTHED
jgi:hypothetical protein